MVYINKIDSIEDTYVFGELLGEGIDGIVKKAVLRSTGEERAVKIVHKSAMDEDEISALSNEINILSEVDHPNIVKLYEAFETDEYFYIVMELMQGGELFDRIIEQEFFSENEAKEVLSPIIDAVNYCHEMDIIHRDLKPENLLYENSDDDSVIKISDFGLAKLVPKSTFASTAWGTPGYVAPEIVMWKRYGKEVDVWSIGIIMYILLCGYPPFYSDNNSELFEMIKTGNFEFHSPYWDQVSTEAKDLIKKLLTVDSKKRITLEQVKEHKWFSMTSKPTQLVREKSYGLTNDFQVYKR
jgi:calcium/calmodulin-dependent protein kinase I